MSQGDKVRLNLFYLFLMCYSLLLVLQRFREETSGEGRSITVVSIIILCGHSTNLIVKGF